MSLIANYFELGARKSTVGREFRGAVATFLTMAYILFANPGILHDGAGVPFESAVACTALAAGICCLLMGFVANFPLAMASGMGLNAVVAYQIAKGSSWQTAMGLIVLDGVVTLALVLGGLREAVMHAIPRDLRLATGAGIGLFIAFIGLANSKIVVAGGATLVKPGTLHDPDTALALAGLLITAVLVARRVPGALVIGILVTTAAALVCKRTTLPSHFSPPSFAVAFQADVRGALHWRFVPMLFSVIMVDFFDTIGTATAVAEQAGLVDDRGRIPGVRRVLVIDSLSAGIGGLLGASSVTAYIESASGVAEGARTGLHTVFVGLFFLAAIVLAPLAGVVPAAATAPALILVGFLMISQLTQIEFDRYDTAIPAFITLLTIPLTYSIAHGIGYGFISYVVIKVIEGKAKDVAILMYLTAAAFLAFFWWGV